jgi:hypothetical protein
VERPAPVVSEPLELGTWLEELEPWKGRGPTAPGGINPPGAYVLAERPGHDGLCIDNSGTGLRVILSCARMGPHGRWVHVSASYRNRIPTWAELVRVRDELVGPERPAVKILPERAFYVNINPHVLHLWTPLDRWPLPEFSGPRRDFGLERSI